MKLKKFSTENVTYNFPLKPTVFELRTSEYRQAAGTTAAALRADISKTGTDIRKTQMNKIIASKISRKKVHVHFRANSRRSRLTGPRTSITCTAAQVRQYPFAGNRFETIVTNLNVLHPNRLPVPGKPNRPEPNLNPKRLPTKASAD